MLFRGRHHYRAELMRLPDELVGAQTPDDAAALLLDRLRDAMASPRALVAVAPDGSRHWVRGVGALEPPSGEVWEALGDVEDPYLTGQGEPGAPLDAWLTRDRLDLALPLRTPDRLVGVLAIATPASTRALGAEDVAVLHVVASSLALALSRTMALETIQKMNEELEERVRERTAELEAARLQLYQQEKMASLGVLAAGVAHELNTPLGVISSMTEQLVKKIMMGEADTTRLARLVALTRDAAGRATGIVRDLSNYSRPESQVFATVDLNEAIDSTLRLLGPMLRDRRIEVRDKRSPEVTEIGGHPVMIAQLVTNLLMNAAQAIVSEGVIRLTLEPAEEEWVRLIVEDDGPGLDPALRDRIFEPFFTTKEPGEGTGLGLSLCYTYVEAHGGRIREEGELGEGARFVVELPFTPNPPRRSTPPATARTTPEPSSSDESE